ncbi:small ribosomal subunit protein mS29 [Centruroides vittatus]|uniref:small ribosomal subunit protein mS29 n=1 Tax=Centruroides vittatus TaxID=120091 RepID=UPI003510C765
MELKHIFKKVRGLQRVKVIYNCCIKNFYSTTASPVVCEDDVKHFRTLESNPMNHTLQHEGKFYSIPPKTYKKLFTLGGFSKSYEVQFKTFRENCIMVRYPALQIMNYLETANYSLPPVHYVIYGRNGTGKSAILNHIVHYASEKNWLLLHIPWAPNWTRRPKDTATSLWDQGTDKMDLPIDSALWLQHFHSQNSLLLQELDLRLSKTYEWSKRESTNEGEPLTALIDKGVNRMKFASGCIAALLQEIKLHVQTGRFKDKLRVLVAIDGVNCFFYPTKLKREDKSVVEPDQVTPIHAFRKLFGNDWTDAAVVTTVDPVASADIKTAAYTPHALLGKEGFDCLDPFVPILVENYTEKEIDSCLDYYVDRMWIQNENGRGETGRKELKFLSGYNPRSLQKICAPI